MSVVSGEVAAASVSALTTDATLAAAVEIADLDNETRLRVRGRVQPPTGVVRIWRAARPSVFVRVTVSALDTIERKARVQEMAVLRRRTPVVWSDLLQARSGQMTLYTLAEADSRTLRGLFVHGDVLYLQTAPEYHLPELAFVATGFTEGRVGLAEAQARVWQVTYVEVDG